MAKFKNRLLEQEKIDKINSKIIALLKNNKLKQATKKYAKIVCYNPFNANVHFEFALAFAKNNKYKNAIEHLTQASDIDCSFLKKLSHKAFEKIPKNLISAIETTERDRLWNVIQFNQIEPNIDKYGAKLIFKKEYKAKIIHFSAAFNERVQSFFYSEFDEFNSENITAKKVFFDLGHLDKTNVHYAQIIVAIKKMSPYLKDCRFFMETEPKSFVDEIIINKGKFYSYRHVCKNSYWDSKIEVIENLSKETPLDLQLKKYLSIEWSAWASLMLGDFTDKRNESFKLYIEKALFYNAKNAEPYHLKGLYYQKKGKEIKAKAHFEKAIQLNKKHTKALYKLGEIAFENNKKKKAIQYYSAVIKLNPKYENALFNRGLAYEKCLKTIKAKKDYQQCVKINIPYLSNKFINSAAILIHNEHYSSALLYLKAILKNNKKHIANLNTREKESNGSSASFYQSQRNKFHEQNTKAYNSIGIVKASQKQDYEKAIKYANLAIDLNNEFTDALYNKAYFLHQLNRVSDAENYYKKVIEIDSNYIKALHNISVILISKNQYKEAIKYNDTVLKLYPNHYEALIVKANVMFNMQKRKVAVEVYKKAIFLEPNNIKGYQGAGLCYAHLRKNKKAVKFYKKALKINPNNHTILSEIGSALNNLEKFDEALTYLNKSIEIEDNYYHPYYCKACVFALNNKLDKALTMIKKTIELAPEQKRILKIEPDFEKIKLNPKFIKIFNSL